MEVGSDSTETEYTPAKRGEKVNWNTYAAGSDISPPGEEGWPGIRDARDDNTGSNEYALERFTWINGRGVVVEAERRFANAETGAPMSEYGRKSTLVDAVINRSFNVRYGESKDRWSFADAARL